MTPEDVPILPPPDLELIEWSDGGGGRYPYVPPAALAPASLHVWKGENVALCGAPVPDPCPVCLADRLSGMVL